MGKTKTKTKTKVKVKAKVTMHKAIGHAMPTRLPCEPSKGLKFQC